MIQVQEISAFKPVLWPQTIVELDQVAKSLRWSTSDILRLWSTHDYLSTLFSGRYRGSGRPFINHLVGTAGLSLMSGGDLSEVLLCYAHAAFEQGEFGHVKQGPTSKNRRDLRFHIGAKAEALVFNYNRLDWLTAVRRFNDCPSSPLIDHQSAVLAARIFNQLDDSLDCSAYDQTWFDECSERLEIGARYFEIIGRVSAETLTKNRVEEMAFHTPIRDDGFRPKRSVTLRNLAYVLKPRLSFGRSFLHGFRRAAKALKRRVIRLKLAFR
jgi:hypothetical protein